MYYISKKQILKIILKPFKYYLLLVKAIFLDFGLPGFILDNHVGNIYI